MSSTAGPPRQPSRGVVLVTGAGRGIGAATATLAAERGYDVAVNYRSDAEAAKSVAERCRSSGAATIVVRADVADERGVDEMFSVVEDRLGPVSVLVNNAGTLETQMRFEDMTVDRWRRVLDVNVIGTFLCARAAVRRMSTRHGGRGGSIVNVSSAAAYLGSPGEYVDYAASKGAVDTFTVGLAKEVALDGVRVNGVRPGVIHTEIHARGGEPDRVDRVAPSVPMQRGGDPAEVAEAILWLASDGASYVTGELINVSGGR